MSILSTVKTGYETRPQKNMILGVNGIGKTTFMSEFPKALIIDLEWGSSNLDVPRIKDIFNLAQFNEALDALYNESHDYQSIGIDTLDSLEKLIFDDLCLRHKWTSIEDAGFGKGYTAAGEMMSRLMQSIMKLNAKGMTINIASHVGIKAHNDPAQPAPYDRWTPRVCKQVAAPVKDLCDNIFFASFKTVVVKENNKSRAFGDGERVLYTQYRPSHDGKNRFGLPYEIPFSYASLKAAIESAKPETKEDLMIQVSELMKSVTDKSLLTKIETAVKTADGNTTQLKAIRTRLQTMIESQ